MKTIKIMGIIGLIFAGISWLVISTCSVYNFQTGLDWGIVVAMYLLAYSIVGIVQSKKNDIDEM